MRPFSYVRAKTAEAACHEATRTSGSAFLAGGTTLLDLMKIDVIRPEHLIDVNKLPLNQINETNGGVIIGALARNSEVAHHPLIIERYPMLSKALLAGATAQLRNMATVGGNLMQKTRCYYYRNTALPCNKRNPGSGCPAIQGFNRIHAILGGSDKCVAVSPSDMCVALVALDAVIYASDGQNERKIPAEKFFLQPGDHPEVDNVLNKNELITAVFVPNLEYASQSDYVKVRDRTSFAFALVSVACAVQLSRDTITGARLAFGGVGTVPWRAHAVEAMLVGQPARKETFIKAAEEAVREAVPLKHNQFKVELLKRTVVKALVRATTRSEE